MRQYNPSNINHQRICELASKFIDKVKQFEKCQQIVSSCLKLSQCEDASKNNMNRQNSIQKQSNVFKAGENSSLGNGAISKKKYRIYSVSFKKRIVLQIKRQIGQENRSLHAVIKQKSEKLGIHIKNLARWYNLKQIKAREGGRKPAYPQIQEKLAAYAKQHPECRRKELIRKAKQYFSQLGLSDNSQFRFSKGWFQRFKCRNLKQKSEEESEEQGQPVAQNKGMTLKSTERRNSNMKLSKTNIILKMNNQEV